MSLDALSDIEYWIREVANDKNESVIVVDLETDETLFVRYGDKDSVTMQDWHQKLAEGRNIVVIHNHPNNSGASPADLSAAAWLDAEYMMIVNRDGTVHRHQKIDGEIVELKPLHNPDIVAPFNPLETVVDSIAYWMQTFREIGNSTEMVFEQEETAAVIEVSGAFRAYGNQWYADERREEIKTFWDYDFTESPQSFKVLRRSALNPSLVQIEVRNNDWHRVYRHWIDLEDLDDKVRILRGDLESVPIKYPLRSFVADEKLDIELIWEDPAWRDKSGVGILSRDLNEYDSTEPFQLQAPTIGPDVIVEFVATGHADLGNYVVISFPASVIQENETVMQKLSGDPNHQPSEWLEDGRIFIAFAHLSDWKDWGLRRPQPGTIIDSPEKGIIGMTGKTGTEANHLDLSVVYFGSRDEGTRQMAHALAGVRGDRTSVDHYFGLAKRSNFVKNPTMPYLYAENVDPMRIWPELDELQRAESTEGKSIYPWKN